ncbi:serine/threonine-protein kinase [Streptomyces sp. NPDC048255]|uniref:serine/threonine-protein kinase n=1 Tax=Streptomyces TaxID=1883 RepID=UPI00340D83AF
MQGTRIAGRYRVAGLIGAGGMGQVWRAYDERLGREVAVKTLAGGQREGYAHAAARFEHEARVVAGLQSRHIVTVHDIGSTRVDDDHPLLFIVMELVTGHPLDLVISNGPPGLDDVMRWAAQVCDALATVHAAGVLHRDLKPANVMVTADGTAKVLDFGIASFLDDPAPATALTATGAALGTPAFMSPEQAQALTVDHRSDLYSLGCVLYNLVTGHPPFMAASGVALLVKHVSEPPVPPSRYNPRLPAALEELILALLAKDPAGRPEGAANVRDRLLALATSTSGLPGPGLLQGLAQRLLGRSSRPAPASVGGPPSPGTRSSSAAASSWRGSPS